LSYCIDTNVFIDAGERYYPPDIVPGFWENLDALIAVGRMSAPEMLITELEGKDDDWREWVYERRETLIVPMDLPQIEAVQKVMAAYTAQGIDANRITGDPFFIGLALSKGLTVVTNEKPRKGGAKIPKICAALGVPSIGLLELMRRENWRLVATG
jgi:predicted nucleic acid-binding protein